MADLFWFCGSSVVWCNYSVGMLLYMLQQPFLAIINILARFGEIFLSAKSLYNCENLVVGHVKGVIAVKGSAKKKTDPSRKLGRYDRGVDIQGVTR